MQGARSPALFTKINPVSYQSYQVRPIRFIELWEPCPGWQLKAYGINVDQARNTASTVVDSKMLEMAKGVIVDALKRPELTGDAVHKVGYMILHQGLLGNWLIFDWWWHDVLWNQFLFRSEAAANPEFVPVTSGIVACVWEVSLMAFERDAWVRLVLKAGQGRDRSAATAAYMNTRFNGDV